MKNPPNITNLPLLGKRAPRIDPRTLHLAKYLTRADAMGKPPAAAEWQKQVASWPMMLNNVLGNCVCAAGGHCVQQWTTYQGDPFTPTDASILKTYEDVGGYIPGNPSTDNGCDMLTYLNYWRKTGVAGHKITAFVAVDTTNDEQFQWAIKLFGNVFLGVQLPLSAANQPAWEVPPEGAIGNGSPGSWGGHCIPVVAFNEPANREWVVTWGGLLSMSPRFRHLYADEAYTMISTDWVHFNGRSPGHFDYATLVSDLNQL